MRDLSASLDGVISPCIKVDDCLQARRGTRNYNSHEPVWMASKGFYCGHKGHIVHRSQKIAPTGTERSTGGRVFY